MARSAAMALGSSDVVPQLPTPPARKAPPFKAGKKVGKGKKSAKKKAKGRGKVPPFGKKAVPKPGRERPVREFLE